MQVREDGSAPNWESGHSGYETPTKPGGSCPRPFLALLEVAAPVVWTLGTHGMGWAVLGFLLAAAGAAFLACSIKGVATVEAGQGRLERWWQQRNAARRSA